MQVNYMLLTDQSEIAATIQTTDKPMLPSYTVPPKGPELPGVRNRYNSRGSTPERCSALTSFFMVLCSWAHGSLVGQLPCITMFVSSFISLFRSKSSKHEYLFQIMFRTLPLELVCPGPQPREFRTLWEHSGKG